MRETIIDLDKVSDLMNVSDVIEELEKHGIDLTADYDDWMRIAFAFANDLGEQGRHLFHRVSRMYPMYDAKECDRKYDNALATQDGRVHLATFYYLAGQAGVALPAQAAGETGKRKAGRPKKSEEERREDKAEKTQRTLETIRSMVSLRNNVLTEQLEIAWKREDPHKWADLDDRALNKLYTDLHLAGVDTTQSQLCSYIDNDELSPSYNPVCAYARSLPAWDGTTDHIGRLFAHLHLTADKDEASFLLRMAKKWYVTMVAVAIEHMDTQNQLMLLLYSEEGGTGKSEFVKRLLPRPLQKYVTSRTYLATTEDKDEILALSNNILYNLDEVSFNRVNYSRIKNMVGGAAAGHTKVRRPYDRVPKVRRTHASFIGTTNQINILPEEMGSRRFVVLAIDGSDDYATLPVDKAFAQAYALVNGGEYALGVTREEMLKLAELNRRYVEYDLVEDVLSRTVRKPEEGEPAVSLQASEIIGHMTRVHPGEYNAQKVGTLLSRMGMQSKKVRGQKKYQVVLLTSEPSQPQLLTA